MIPTRVMGIQISNDGKCGVATNNLGITPQFSNSHSMGNLTFAGTTGPPLQMAMSGWVENEQSDSFLEIITDINGEKTSTFVNSAICPKITTTYPMPTTIVEPPTSSENQSSTTDEYYDAKWKDALLTTYSDYQVRNPDPDVLSTKTDSRSSPSFVCSYGQVNHFTSESNLNTPLLKRKRRTRIGMKRKTVRYPSIPRPIISHSNSVCTNIDVPLRLKTVHIDFETNFEKNTLTVYPEGVSRTLSSPQLTIVRSHRSCTNEPITSADMKDIESHVTIVYHSKDGIKRVLPFL